MANTVEKTEFEKQVDAFQKTTWDWGKTSDLEALDWSDATESEGYTASNVARAAVLQSYRALEIENEELKAHREELDDRPNA